MSLAAFGHFQNGVLQLHPNFSVSHFDGLTLDDIDFAEILGSGRAVSEPQKGNGRANSEAPKGSGRAISEAPKGSGRAVSEAPKGSGRAISEALKGSGRVISEPDDKIQGGRGRAENPVFNTNCVRIIDVDASQVQHCDSIGIAALLWLLQQANAENLTLKCIHLPPKMQQLLKLYELPFLEDSSNYARRID